MVSADVALALLINRTTEAYVRNRPAYIAYDEYTHIAAPSLNRSQDMNRSVVARNADDVAVMRDLPNGGESVGQAFPIIPYFDPISAFSFSYYANLKRVDISLQRQDPITLPVPQTDSSVSVVVPYNSFWAAHYAPDSTESAIHVVIDPTARVGGNDFYPSEVVEDGATHLPKRIVMSTKTGDEQIALDYAMVAGRWTIVHGTFSATEHMVIVTTKVIADVRYENITFPDTVQDPRLSTNPVPISSPTTK